MRLSTPVMRTIAPARRCARCEYNLQGLAADAACPECGWDPLRAAALAAAPVDAPHRRAAWCHLAGVVLLLMAMMQGLGVVLIERPADDVTGNTPLMNVPGPKFWATPALRRSTGRYVSDYGAAGVETSIFCVAAVWLLTVRRPDEKGDVLRQATRWGATLLGGANVGMVMGISGISQGGRVWSTVQLGQVAFVELPATVLLYARLAQLASRQSLEIRRALAPLVVAVPALIAAAAAMLLWRLTAGRQVGWDDFNFATVGLVAAYGAAAMAAGVWATITLVRLGLALLGDAWPGRAQALRAFWRGTMATGGFVARAALRPGGFAVAARGRALLGAILLALLLLGHYNLLGDIISMPSGRAGLGSNMPFMNYPGPKVWGVPLTLSDGTGFASMVTMGVGIALLTFACAHAAPRTATVLRWGLILAVGGAGGAAFAYGPTRYWGAWGSYGITEAAAMLIMLIEAPLNCLLYYWLSLVAREYGRSRAATALKRLAVVVPLLQASALGILVLGRATLPSGVPMREARMETWVIAGCGVYGALMLAVAVIATAALVSLIGGMLARALQEPPTIERRVLPAAEALPIRSSGRLSRLLPAVRVPGVG